MIIVNHKKFLSKRFDLVIRWYFLEKTGFDAEEAKLLAGSSQYVHLRAIFTMLLKQDTKIPHILNKVRKTKEPVHMYGYLVARQLFFLPNWHWIERQMEEGDGWIGDNPYPIRFDGLGLSVKRFVLALKYKRNLYWEIKKKGKAPLQLWNQHKYRKMMKSHEYDKIKEAEHRMLIRMKELNFFSDEFYRGNEVLLKAYG